VALPNPPRKRIKVKELTAWETYKKALLTGEINADTFAELTANLKRGE
jgi:hypothetical protein